MITNQTIDEQVDTLKAIDAKEQADLIKSVAPKVYPKQSIYVLQTITSTYYKNDYTWRIILSNANTYADLYYNEEYSIQQDEMDPFKIKGLFDKAEPIMYFADFLDKLEIVRAANPHLPIHYIEADSQFYEIPGWKK